MPYIKPDGRPPLDELINALVKRIQGLGSLNYVITKLCLGFIDAERKPAYTKVVAIVGTVQSVAYEFYRRYAAPYEDLKAKENGDVYTDDRPPAGHEPPCGVRLDGGPPTDPVPDHMF